MSKKIVVCVNCGKKIERYPSQCLGTIYCSRDCRGDYMKKNNTTVFKCVQCSKETRVRKSSFDENSNNFCSRRCKDNWQKTGLMGEANPFYGKTHTEEAKKRMIESSKKLNLTGKNAHNYNTHIVKCDYCGQPTYKIAYLIKRSKYLFCSIDCHAKWKSENLCGENNHMWNSNLTDEERVVGRKYPEYYDFTRKVLDRDDHTCDVCDSSNKSLNVHHLNSYHWDEENRTELFNGITLCTGCHKQFHKTYGYKFNTVEQYKEFRGTTSL